MNRLSVGQYQPHCGNYILTRDEFIENIEIIEEWLDDHPDYFMVHQSIPGEYNSWFVTNWLY